MRQSTDFTVRLFPERSVQAILEGNKNHSSMLKQKIVLTHHSLLEPHLHKVFLKLVNNEGN